MQNIVIVGGGAGGLELATRLGHRLGKRRKRILFLSIVVKLISGSRCYMKWQPARLIAKLMALSTARTLEDTITNFKLGRWRGLIPSKSAFA